MTTPLAYNVRDAAAMSGVSVETIRRAVADGKLSARFAGRGQTRLIIKHAELESWLDALPEESGANGKGGAR